MANEVQIIISAVDKASAEFDKMGSKTKAFAAGLAIVATAAVAVGTVVMKVVNETVEYGKQVDDLSRSLGINAQESSKLIQIADDLRIDVGTLKMGFKAALKEGVAPNIEGIKGLAKQYQELKTPVEKAQFSMQYFGRAGLELNKILELTPGEIDAMAQSAEDAGLVLSGEAVQSTKDLWSEMDTLNDSVSGVKTQLAIGLMPALIETAKGANDLITRVNELNKTNAVLDAAYKAGNITWQERIKLGWENVRGTIDLTTVTALQSAADIQLTDDRQEGIIAAENLKTATDNLTASEEIGTAATDLAIKAIQASNLGLGEKKRLIDLLAIANGTLTETELALSTNVGIATKLLDQGRITWEQYLEIIQALNADATNFNAILKALHTSIDELPEYKQIVIDYNIKHTGGTPIGEEPGPGVPLPPGGPEGPPKGGTLQAGGPVSAGVPYLVGEAGPEMFVPNTSGRIVNNWSLTINEAGHRGNVVNDFALLKALARA